MTIKPASHHQNRRIHKLIDLEDIQSIQDSPENFRLKSASAIPRKQKAFAISSEEPEFIETPTEVYEQTNTVRGTSPSHISETIKKQDSDVVITPSMKSESKITKKFDTGLSEFCDEI